MPDKKSRSKEPDMGSLELTEELIRQRAYHFWEQRGCGHGHDVDDWLRAEAEVMGKKSSDSLTAPARTAKRAVA